MRGVNFNVFFAHGGFFGRDVHGHSLAFEHGHWLYLAVFFQVVGKTEEQYFALLFEKDASTTEEHVSLDFVAFAQEAFRVLEFEVVVVVVGLWTETNFFDFHLHLLGFEFLLALLLLVDEFGEIH